MNTEDSEKITYTILYADSVLWGIRMKFHEFLSNIVYYQIIIIYQWNSVDGGSIIELS